MRLHIVPIVAFLFATVCMLAGCSSAAKGSGTGGDRWETVQSYVLLAPFGTSIPRCVQDSAVPVDKCTLAEFAVGRDFVGGYWPASEIESVDGIQAVTGWLRRNLIGFAPEHMICTLEPVAEFELIIAEETGKTILRVCRATCVRYAGVRCSLAKNLRNVSLIPDIEVETLREMFDKWGKAVR